MIVLVLVLVVYVVLVVLVVLAVLVLIARFTRPSSLAMKEEIELGGSSQTKLNQAAIRSLGPSVAAQVAVKRGGSLGGPKWCGVRAPSWRLQW